MKMKDLPLTQILGLLVGAALLVSIIGGGVGFVIAENLAENNAWFRDNIYNGAGGESQFVYDSNHVITLDEDDDLVDLVEKSRAAVVSIVGKQEVELYRSRSFFDQFWGADPEDVETEERTISSGSGFIIDAEGTILTNEHVVDQEAEYVAILDDGREFALELIAKDGSQYKDFAVMKIQAEDEEFSFLELGDSDSLNVGQTVIAIGNPLGEFANSVTRGIVSGMGREISATDGYSTEELYDVIQTDAAINPGNSGGPLLNLAGQVVGINTAVSQNGQSLGFAVSINSIKDDLRSIEENGEIVRPFLGVRYLTITPAVQERNNLDYDYGVILSRGDNPGDLAVLPGSPADKAGLEENDIILEVNGAKLDSSTSLARELQRFNVGDEVTLKVSHDGEEKEVVVVLEQDER